MHLRPVSSHSGALRTIPEPFAVYSWRPSLKTLLVSLHPSLSDVKTHTSDSGIAWSLRSPKSVIRLAISFERHATPRSM
jgi:hypothetical protein